MDSRIEAVLTEYHQRSAEESRRFRELPPEELRFQLDRFLLAVGPETGAFLNALAKGARAQTIVELGTSYGYSTLWLAEAARATGGRVITLEIHRKKSEHARAALERAGLVDHVDFRVGDAVQTLAGIDAAVDLVLIDLWKELYIPCFDLLHPKLAPGAIVVADNMLEPVSARAKADAYRAHVRANGSYDSVLLPIGSGLEVSRRRES